MAGQSAAFGCSALAINSASTTILGRNLDWPDLPDATNLRIGDYTLVNKRLSSNHVYRVTSIGFPGMIGDLSGINEKGLALVICESGRSVGKGGTPYSMVIRKALEKAESVDEVREFFIENKTASSINVTAVDKKHITSMQLDPETDEYLTEIIPDDAKVIATNHFIDPYTHEVIPRSIADESSMSRYGLMTRSVESDTKDNVLTDEVVKNALSIACESDTIQAMVIEPGTLSIQLSIQKEWAAFRGTAQYVKFPAFENSV
jgi:predicted choloylglycine hydrolase